MAFLSRCSRISFSNLAAFLTTCFKLPSVFDKCTLNIQRQVPFENYPLNTDKGTCQLKYVVLSTRF